MTLRLTSPRRRRADARSGQASDPHPPRLADALLKRVLPTGKSGESILGDLREEFREMVARAETRTRRSTESTESTMQHFIPSRRLSAAAVAVALGVATAYAGGTRPDFSGTWLLNAAKSAGLRDDERTGVTLVVRQSDREIVFERTLVGGEPRVVRYALDGSEATSQAGNAEIKARSRWDGDKLVTEGTQRATVLLIRITAKFKETRYVTDGGQTMVVESTFWRGNEQTDRKLVFNRRAE